MILHRKSLAARHALAGRSLRRGGLGDTPWKTGIIPGENMAVDAATAASIAAATGGTIIERPWGQTDILLPTGQVVNAGALAGIYLNPVWQSNPAMQQAEVLKVLNSDSCITEYGNVVSNCSNPPAGNYSFGAGGQLQLDPHGVPVQPQSQILSQSQYQAWQQSNAGLPTNLPVSAPAPRAPSAPAALPAGGNAPAPPAGGNVPAPPAGGFFASSDSAAAAGGGGFLQGSMFGGIPNWVLLAGVAGVFLASRGGGR